MLGLIYFASGFDFDYHLLIFDFDVCGVIFVLVVNATWTLFDLFSCTCLALLGLILFYFNLVVCILLLRCFDFS